MSEITEDYEDWDRADLVREAEDLATDLRSKEKTIREQRAEIERLERRLARAELSLAGARRKKVRYV